MASESDPEHDPRGEADDSASALFAQLACTPDGLSTEEAEERRLRYGRNELPERRESPLLRLLRNFWGPIPWMIEAAAILSAVVGHWADLGIILVLLLANALVAFWEEYQAGNAVEALKKNLSLEARAKRDGSWVSVASADLVPGDVIRLRLGNIVPADAVLIEDQPLEVDQSALTGESLPVGRSRGDEVLSSSIVRQGESDALVVRTGASTFMGHTTRLVADATGVSHFQRTVLKIGDYLIALAIVLVALIITVALFRGDPFVETLQFALVLVVAAAPVALPTVLSVTMAVGARKLAQKRAIVTRLTAIEELAGVDVLCTDKTGTITQNRLTLGEARVMAGSSEDDLLRAAALASRSENKDPIDDAVLQTVASRSITTDGYRVGRFTPFDPVRKRTEAEVTTPDGAVVCVSKGAPQVIASLAGPGVEEEVARSVDAFAARGFRALGVAQRDGSGPWRVLGVLPLLDPPREDSAEVVEQAHGLGVDVKMVTGDQLAIAREIAQRVGLGTELLDASTFDEGRADGEVGDSIEHADGFAQVFPEHKHRIVSELQRRGHIVGMTGDGVNDAPALKKADAGIAVLGATEAARAAADIVLLTPGLSVIIGAIRGSRRIFQRMNSYAVYRIAETVRVLFFMTLSILVFNFYPLTAVMIVLLALLNDAAILSIAYDRVHDDDRPQSWRLGKVLGVSTALGIAGVFSSFGLFYLAEEMLGLDRATVQTLMYLKLSVAGHMMIFVTRTRGPFWTIRPAGVLVGAVVLTQILATLVAVFGLFMTPIGWELAAIVWVYAGVWFFVSDLVKLLAYRLMDAAPSVLTRRGTLGVAPSGTE